MSKFMHKETLEKSLFGFFFILVFYLSVIEPKLLGFINSHHGWVSAEQLAIIVRSTLENNFVGYRMLFDGGPSYFSKAPFPSYAIFNLFLIPFEDVSTKLFVARSLMDILYLLNIVLLFGLVYQYSKNWKISAISTILGFSGYYAVYYRDLIVPDNFLVLSFILSGYAMYYAKINRIKKSYFVMLLSVSMGYVLVNTIPYIIWGIYEIYNKIRHKYAIKKYIFIIFFSGMISFSYFSYNILMEANTRSVTLQQTDIFASMMKRAGQDGSYKKAYKDKLDWNNHLPLMLNRFFEKSLIPAALQKNKYKRKNVEKVNYNPLYFIVIFLLLNTLYKNPTFNEKSKNLKPILLILIVSASYMFFVLKGYALHDFSAVTLSITATFAWFIILLNFTRFFYILAPLTILIFYFSNITTVEYKQTILEKKKVDIYDFDKINLILSKEDAKVIFIEEGYRNLVSQSPYSSGFLLSDYRISNNKEKCDFMISTKNIKNTLTPNNRFHFLYAREDIEKYYTNKITKEKFNDK